MADFGPTPRILSTGLTSKESANGFVRVQIQGVKEMLQRLQGFIGVLESDSVLKNAVEEGAKIIRDDYRRRAQIHMATGNLAKSVKIQPRRYDNGASGVAMVAVVGPEFTGAAGASEGNGSGNHALLVEFGSGPRRPGTNNRRRYVNVHQKINGRMGPMRKVARMHDEDFEKAGAGYYFLMGSLRERANQPAGRPGYSRDFADGPGPRQHPITLRPGDTIAPMPPMHMMRETIGNQQTNVYNAVIRVLRNAVSAYAA